MPTPASVLAFLRRTPTIARLKSRSLISVTGSQAADFLNGLLATSVPRTPLTPFYSAFLHAQGRVMYDVFVHSTLDAKSQTAFLIEYDPTVARSAQVPELLPLLKRHVLRSKVRIRDVTEEHDVWAVWGGEGEGREEPRQWSWASSGVIEPVWDRTKPWPWGTGQGVISDRRAVGMGSRRLVEKGKRPQEASTHEEGSDDDYLLHRIMHGVPEGANDIVPMQAFPMDSNLDIMGGLDFRKGCYTGQELTVRTYHTGVIRKRILPVVIHEPTQTPTSKPHPTTDSFSPGTEVRASLTHAPSEGRTARPRRAGKLLSNTRGVGLALLRLEHVEKGDLKFELELTGGDIRVLLPWWPDWWPTEHLALNNSGTRLLSA
ncbi:Aminomethyltransferase folate-binding domain-containing protein [Artomyces pyxidatus]|uniref:Aminomethyltransferase folate-binding domain-containing protein n=1 Tax=Artomyces pyxidatus TaxID=48021 RepID=A0ACB8TKT0_9AGAM|nr:Aminomethyltransferase folate-binding domain-containing protein [Artomyces pyxidatus]